MSRATPFHIEESVQLADRVVILSHRPGTICTQIEVELLRPRDLDYPAYLGIRDEIFHTMGMSLKVGSAESD
jgi:NitT/TauT family transport system ATP-binding protein